MERIKKVIKCLPCFILISHAATAPAPAPANCNACLINIYHYFNLHVSKLVFDKEKGSFSTIVTYILDMHV